MNKPQIIRLSEFVDLLIAGTITADQHEQLQELLKDNPEAQSAYIELMDLHIGLQKLTTAEPPAKQRSEFPAGQEQLSSTEATTTNSENTNANHRSQNRGSHGVMIAMAVVLIVGLQLILQKDGSWFHPAKVIKEDNSQEQIAYDDYDELGDVLLTQSAGAELFGEILPQVGSALQYEHEYALVAGLIELRFPDGAEVILEAPSLLKITGRERLLVSAGECSVYAPPGAEGFQIETPLTEITDLGTRFSVSVSEMGETDVQVVEGLAEVLTKQNHSIMPIQLTERQARRFTGSGGSEPKSLEFDANVYRNSLPDRIVSYDVNTTDEGYAWDLKSVSVQRNGVVQVIAVDKLIGIKLLHFRGETNDLNVVVPIGYHGDRLAVLESDRLLHTGLINPGGSSEPLRENPVIKQTDGGPETTPGIAFQFNEAVVNGPGPDVVLFELQSITNPLEGDPFHVSPLRFEEGLHTHTVRSYDITMTSPQAHKLPDIELLFFSEAALSLDSLITKTAERRIQKLRFHAIAVGIDLSDLGYKQGASVKELFIQDILDDEYLLDPVFIAGLPALP